MDRDKIAGELVRLAKSLVSARKNKRVIDDILESDEVIPFSHYVDDGLSLEDYVVSAKEAIDRLLNAYADNRMDEHEWDKKNEMFWEALEYQKKLYMKGEWTVDYSLEDGKHRVKKLRDEKAVVRFVKRLENGQYIESIDITNPMGDNYQFYRGKLGPA